MAVAYSQHGVVVREGSKEIRQKFVDKIILGSTYKCVEISDKVFFPMENLRYKDSNIDYITSSSNIDLSASQCFFYSCDEQQYGYNGYIYTEPAINYVMTLISGTVRAIQSSDVTLIYNYIKKLLEEAQSAIPNAMLDNYDFTNLSKDVNVGWTKAYGKINLGFRPTGYFNYSKNFNGITSYFGIGSTNYRFIDIQSDTSQIRFVDSASWSNHAYCSRFIIDEN